MKNLIAFILCLVAALGLCSCNSAPTSTENKFIPLEDDQTLCVGSYIFMNYENKTTSTTYLTFTKKITYRLVSSYYSNGTQSVEYNGRYYYWEKSETTDEEILGNKTVKTTVLYSYLPYTNAENIAVKSTQITSTSFDYAGGFVTKPYDLSIDFSNYFSSAEDLKNALPDLYNQLPAKAEKTYYIDVTVVPTTQTSTQTYTSTYYYFE